MRSAAMGEATRRLARRELLLGGFTFLMAVIGLASLAAVAIAGTGAGLRAPGAEAGGAGAGGEATLVAMGYGETAVGAETATLQLLLGPSEPGVMISSGSGGGDPAAEPGEAERQAAEPIAQAIQSVGVLPEEVSMMVSPALPNGYYGSTTGYGVRIDVRMRQPTTEMVNRVVDAAGAAAIEADLRLSQVGVGFGVGDCAALERQARERAIAAARANAEQQAELLGAPLGALLLSRDEPGDVSDGAAPATGCGMPTGSRVDPEALFGGGGGITLPSFLPGQAAEATARVRVSLTFALPEE